MTRKKKCDFNNSLYTKIEIIIIQQAVQGRGILGPKK